MTTTPYELRFTMLRFAYDMLSNDLDMRWRELELLKQMGKLSEQSTTVDLPDRPSVEQVFELAEKINGFVSGPTRPKK